MPDCTLDELLESGAMVRVSGYAAAVHADDCDSIASVSAIRRIGSLCKKCGAPFRALYTEAR